MATTPIKQLTENGKDFFPRTHTKAVIDNDGRALDATLTNLSSSIGGIQAIADTASSAATDASSHAAIAANQAATANSKVTAVQEQLAQIIANGTTDATIAAQLSSIRAEVAALPKRVVVTEEQWNAIEAAGTYQANTYYDVIE